MKRLLIGLLSISLWASPGLIKEVESLRSSLAKNDPGQIRLSLKLADLYFDQYLDVDKALLENKDKNRENLRQLSLKKSLEHYHYALSGAKGKLKKPKGQQQIKIWFQLARLYSASFKKIKAINYYKKVIQSKQTLTGLRREAGLNLAEILEADAKDKEALKYYGIVLSSCENSDVCIYARYKKAWVHYRRGNLATATQQLSMALFDSRGQVRTQALQDYLLFLSQATTDGSKQIDVIQKLSAKINKPRLIKELAEAFFAVGNREAGTKALALDVAAHPRLLGKIRLLEEYYGFSRSKDFTSTLEELKKYELGLPSDLAERRECHKILARLIVQLDGERKSKTAMGQYLADHILLFLHLFPEAKEKNKMMEGWLAATKDAKAKIDRLGIWLTSESAKEPQDEKLISRFRQLRLSLAQKVKNQDVILIEAKLLAEAAKTPIDKRKYNYIGAREYYEMEAFAKALPFFIELAKPEVIDSWSVKAQNLVLDIYNQQKKYKRLMEQADLWLINQKLQSNRSLGKELASMRKIRVQAEFEYASSLGQSPEALAIFERYCANNKFTEKSCSNAKVLAVKLADQKSILNVLKLTKSTDEMTAQLELMGEFEKSADLLKKQKPSGDVNDHLLKVAMFYELENKIKKRDRILKKIVKNIRKSKTIDKKQEPIIYEVLKDAGKLSPGLLSLPWSPAKKMSLAEDLEAMGKGQKKTKKLLMGSQTWVGPAWSKYVLDHVYGYYKKQKKRKFYGRRSERKFKQRISRIERLVKETKRFLEGANLKTRVYLLETLKTTYAELAAEIMATPLPKDLPEESKTQIMASLAQMAAPFEKELAAYTKLQAEQLVGMTPEEQTSLREKMAKADLRFSSLIEGREVTEKTKKGIADLDSLVEVKSKLAKNPYDENSLKQFAEFFEGRDLKRLAAYFHGRIKLSKE